MIYHHSFGKHRLMKKIFSVCIILMLIFCVSIPTFAEDIGESTESNLAQQPAPEITENLSEQDDRSRDVDAYANKKEEETDTKIYSGDAAIYYLANPAGDPWTNDTGAWAPSKESSETLAKINTTNAIWEDGYVGNTSYKEKNIKQNVSSYITSWPDGSKGNTWTVKREDPNTNKYFVYILDSIWDNYKTAVAKDLEIDVSRLGKEDITEITLTPRKISRDNGGSYPYHIDCALSIKSRAAFTAKFWVKEPQSNEYTQVDAKNYITGSQVTKTTKIEIGSTKIVNGVTYILDGWYAENTDGNAYGNKIENIQWSYTPNAAELADGTVNFYAHYSPVYTSVNISKNVTGALGDLTKEFQFTVTVRSGTMDLAFKIDDQDYTGTATITLKNGETKTLQDVPTNATVVVTESDYGAENGGYTTSYVVDGGNRIQGREATITNTTVNENGYQIIFTNNKDAIPDTGIHFSSALYVMMLVLVSGGLITFFLCRRCHI